MKIRDIDIFSPYLIILGIFLYLILALIGFQYQIRGLKSVSSNIILYIFYGTFFFLMGILTPKILTYINVFNSISLNSRDTFRARITRLFANDKFNERLVLSLVLVGIMLQVLNIYLLGGIPLLSGYLKAKAVTKIWLLSYLIFLPSINILIAKFPKKQYFLLFLLGLFLFAATGYRTTAMAIIISVFITTYYVKKMKIGHILVFTILAVIIGISVGYIAVKSIEWQQWALNPLELVFYRAAFTLNVLDLITRMQGATGGNLFYYTLTGYLNSVDPRVIVGKVVVGYRQSITSTIFGPALLDFGYIALAIQMFLLGLILKLLHNLQKIKKGVYTAFYAIIMSHTLLWIETGPTDLVVWIFYVVGIILIILG